jgi:lysozyme family protein
MSRFRECLEIVLKHEGGWADHPKDPGGATMKGVTIGVFAQFKGRKVTKEELRAISQADLEAIYRRKYWDKVLGDWLPAGVDLAVFDAAVNSGVSQSTKWLQRAVGAKDDGRMGPATLDALASRDPSAVVLDMVNRRMAMLRGLRTWGTFGRGWTRRVDDVRDRALAMAGRPTPLAGHPVTTKPVVDHKGPIRERQDPIAAFFASFFARFKR